MNETTRTSATSLAITEKRAHRPGGCAGIFFQLFEWNRRFAKKLFSSKKLLPPSRAKQASRRFGVDEKMPKTKLHLIDDENSGGFPNVKKIGHRSSFNAMEQKNEMRAPGLVARLMGLDSLPAVNRDKHKKASNSGNGDVGEDKFVNFSGGVDRESLILEKGSAKVDSRPQKLQKTGQSERHVVTRIGADALQIRNVLSRSRKHHHRKLASPVKSPRISSSRNASSRASRLIDAATRILEPGLQATNRAKCALTYSGSVDYAPRDEAMEQLRVMPSDAKQQQNNSNCNTVGVSKSLTGQASCRNCGNLVDVLDSGPNLDKKSFVFPASATCLVNNSMQESERIKPRPHISSPRQETEMVYQKNGDQLSIASERQHNVQPHSESMADALPLFQEGQLQQQLRRPQKDETCPVVFKQRAHPQYEMVEGRDRTPSRARLIDVQSNRASSAANAFSGTKDFVALNKSLSGHNRSRMSTRLDNSTIDTERKICIRRDDFSSQLKSPVRKRRTVSANAQIESTGSANRMTMRQRNFRCAVASGKESGLNTSSKNHTCVKSRPVCPGEGNKANAIEDNNVVSFTFSSSLGKKAFIPTEMEERSDQINMTRSYQRKLVMDEHDGIPMSQKQWQLRGDALGLLLEQKLKELTSQEDERSTAMVLQDIILALNAENPSSCKGHISRADPFVQTEEKIRASKSTHYGDHLSPGSVLEASFSNESCLSSSLNDCSGHGLLPDSADYLCNQPHPVETEMDLLDSATSINRGTIDSKIVTNLLSHISKILQSINLAGGRLTDSRLTYVKEVILKAELLFGNASPHNSDRTRSFLIGPFLLGELETLAGAMWTNFNHLFGFDESKESDTLRRFLFDCVIEFLDSKYGRYCDSGFKAWKRVPLCKNAEMMVHEVGEEIRRWTNLAGMIPDEIIEWEMSHSLGKWTDFEIEAFETGMDVDSGILEALVGEIVMDLWMCRSSTH
uniref:Uncharacterized protein LOC8269347 n=2 Tax=Rhizophora mucronata TaxID=61149 RepID=A0A2P2JPC2_RHIMU